MESTVKEIPVVWYQAASCSGDSVSLLNSASPNVRNILIDEIIPGHHINLLFHMTVMAGQGEPVMEILRDTAETRKGGYLLVVEGTIPTAANGAMGSVGEKGGKPLTMVEAVDHLGRNALAALAVGTCASFGGIFAAEPNPSGSMGLADFFRSRGIPDAGHQHPRLPDASGLVHRDGGAHPAVRPAARRPARRRRPPAQFLRVADSRELSAAPVLRRRQVRQEDRRRRLPLPRRLQRAGELRRLPRARVQQPHELVHPGRVALPWLHGAGFPDKLSPLYQKLTEERLARFFLS